MIRIMHDENQNELVCMLPDEWKTIESIQINKRVARPILNEALLLIDNVINELQQGFIVCETCGDQEPTKDMDCEDSVLRIKQILLELIKE